MTSHDRPRFWTPQLTSSQVTLSDAEAHHAVHVLRLEAGDAVRLFDGRGARAEGRIASVKRSEVTVDVGTRLPPAPPPRPAVHLAFAVPKGKRLDWLLEKATELAAASLQPVCFERRVAGGESLSQTQCRRWLDHCIAAAKQCGLDRLPEIRQTVGLNDLPAEPAGALRLLGSADASAEAIHGALPAAAPEEVMILVGPEGGLTDHESARAAQAGFHGVRLGHTVLRLETAAVALLAAVVARYS
jgi:16S rRNA (uracil1498-N3)-methyltransferase